mmetsp:Transcript_31438/g.45837  ORF Transcript_31438/g.45837 Transcript_31438/m.45837 type:complete len:311 (-) Transcript_31438:99-1031(-)
MPNNSIAGDLPRDDDLNAILQIKKGTVDEQPRGGPKKNFTFKVSEGFLILKAKIHIHASPLPDDAPIFFKKSKNATQAQYVEMTAENFVEYLKARWSKITELDMTRWGAANTTAAAGTFFEVFVYKPRFVYKSRPAAQARQEMRRATAAAVRRERIRIQNHAQANNLQIGPIHLQQLAVHNARNARAAADGAEGEVMIPDDATNRQAARLDEARAALDNEDEQAAQERNSLMRPIQLELNGTIVSVNVNVRSLRTALGLPQHDLFHQGIYNGYVHPDLAAEDDMEDVELPYQKNNKEKTQRKHPKRVVKR